MDKNMEISWGKTATTALNALSSFPNRINVEKTSEQCFQLLQPQKTKKAAQQDRYLSVGLDDKQVDDGNGLEVTI